MAMILFNVFEICFFFPSRFTGRSLIICRYYYDVFRPLVLSLSIAELFLWFLSFLFFFRNEKIRYAIVSAVVFGPLLLLRGLHLFHHDATGRGSRSAEWPEEKTTRKRADTVEYYIRVTHNGQVAMCRTIRLSALGSKMINRTFFQSVFQYTTRKTLCSKWIVRFPRDSAVL